MPEKLGTEISGSSLDAASGKSARPTLPDLATLLNAMHLAARLATIVETSADAIVSMANDGTILSWNPGAERIFGYTAEEIIDRSERILFADGADVEFEERYKDLGLGEHSLRDTVRRRKDGSLVDIAMNTAPMRPLDGGIVGFSATLRDISERKRAEKHMQIVMRELSHRTKNLLAVIIAMVRLTASSTTDAAVLQSELIERLQGLSAAHDLLVSDGWAGVSLRELIHAVLRAFVTSTFDAVECCGPSVTINAVAAQNLGLAFHELATNAAKYGALSTPDGRVRLTWSFEPDDKNERRLTLDWSERNGPAVEQPKIKGFGRVILQSVAAQALNANVAYEFPKEGVRWSIAIPENFVVLLSETQTDLAKASAWKMSQAIAVGPEV